MRGIKASDILSVVLFCIFLSQCYISINKYLDKEVGKSLGVAEEEVLYLPAVTICPLYTPDVYPKTDSFQDLFGFMPQIEDYLIQMELSIEPSSAYRAPKFTPKEAIERGYIKSIVSFPFIEMEGNLLTVTNCLQFQGMEYPVAGTNMSFLQLGFKLEARKFLEYAIWYHAPGEFYPLKYTLFNTPMSTYGATDLRQGFLKFLSFNVRVKNVHKYSTEAKPCIIDDKAPKIEECLRSFITSELGCSITKNSSEENICESGEQFRKYRTLGSKFLRQTDKDIHRMTGCTKRCNTNEFKLIVEGETVGNSSFMGQRDMLWIFFFSTEVQIEVEKDALLYDFNNLVADIGGFLGLLLGASVLGVFKIVEEIVTVGATKSKKVTTPPASAKA